MLERDLRVSKDVNIAIYTTSDFPYGGAPENFVRQMALGLNSLDTFVKIILLRGHYTESTINDTGIDCSNLLFKRRFRRQFLKFVELVFIIFAIPYSVIRNRIQHRTKVILLYGVEYFYLVLPFFIVGKILGIKVYRVITDRYTDRGIAPTWWKWPKVFFYQLQYNYFDRYLAGVICLSNYLKDHAIAKGHNPNSVCVIPHFIDIERFSNEASKITPFQGEKTRIGICGTLNKENGLFVLLKAFVFLKNDYPDIELTLIGPASEADSVVSKEILKEVLGSVHFVGRVNGSLVPELLSTCDILVNPRISGTFADAGFPTKLGEYFATKRPVVATAVGDLNLYFENKRELVLVEPDSAEAIADGILLLIRNKELAKQIGNNGFNWARENVEYIKSSKRLLEFIGN
jgi:Glycosyltransferase